MEKQLVELQTSGSFNGENATDDNLATLHATAWNDYVDMVQALLDAKANLNKWWPLGSC